MNQVVRDEYKTLKLLLKGSGNGRSIEENYLMIEAFFTAIISCLGYDVDRLRSYPSYSVMDWFIEKDGLEL